MYVEITISRCCSQRIKFSYLLFQYLTSKEVAINLVPLHLLNIYLKLLHKEQLTMNIFYKPVLWVLHTELRGGDYVLSTIINYQFDHYLADIFVLTSLNQMIVLVKSFEKEIVTTLESKKADNLVKELRTQERKQFHYERRINELDSIY